MWKVNIYKLAVVVLILLMFSVNVASAAPVTGKGSPDYCEKVTFTNVFIKDPPSCILGYCAASVFVKWFGMSFWGIVKGWRLTQGQHVNVEARVCTDGTASWFRLVK